MSRLAKGLVALCVLLALGGTTGTAPASAGLLGPLGPSNAPPKQPPSSTPPTTAPPAKPTPPTTAKPAAKPTTTSTKAEPRLARGPVTPANSTTDLLAALQPLADRGMPMSQLAAIGFGRFPIGGPTRFADTWMAPRPNPRPHWHKGTDLFAPRGTVVRAVSDGVVEHRVGGAGGNAVWLHAADGTDFYFAHLATFEPMPGGRVVTMGDVLGTVGTSGNAEGDAPHIHFEIHLARRGPINPKPILDAWLREAIGNAPTVLAPHLAAPGPVVMTGDDAAKALLRPLTPPALLDVLGLR